MKTVTFCLLLVMPALHYAQYNPEAGDVPEYPLSRYLEWYVSDFGEHILSNDHLFYYDDRDSLVCKIQIDYLDMGSENFEIRVDSFLYGLNGKLQTHLEGTIEADLSPAWLMDSYNRTRSERDSLQTVSVPQPRLVAPKYNFTKRTRYTYDITDQLTRISKSYFRNGFWDVTYIENHRGSGSGSGVEIVEEIRNDEVQFEKQIIRISKMNGPNRETITRRIYRNVQMDRVNQYDEYEFFNEKDQLIGDIRISYRSDMPVGYAYAKTINYYQYDDQDNLDILLNVEWRATSGFAGDLYRRC